jgi:hypothetical protein
MRSPKRTRHGWLASAAASALTLGAASHTAAQVVQLPAFEFFGASTTVVVPDRGGLTAASVARGRAASGRRGMPVGPRANDLFASRQATGLGVTATVHDLAELDRQILARAPRATIGAKPAAQRGVLALQKENSSATRPAASLASIRAERAAGNRGGGKDADAQKYLEQAETARAEGAPALARMYYQMAARRTSGELSGQIAARLASLER